MSDLNREDMDGDELATYLAAQLANAAHPIVEQWQDFKRFCISQNDEAMSTTVTRTHLNALERALADLYAVMPDLQDDE